MDALRLCGLQWPSEVVATPLDHDSGIYGSRHFQIVKA